MPFGATMTGRKLLVMGFLLDLRLWRRPRPALRASARCHGRPPREEEPAKAMEDQVDSEEKSYNPEPGRRPTNENCEAREDSKDAGQEDQPTQPRPIADTDVKPNAAGDEQNHAEHVCQDERAGDRLADENYSADDIQKAQEDLPHESAPSLGPECVEDLEHSTRNGANPDQYRADDRGHNDVTQDNHARNNEYDSQQNANPKRQRSTALHCWCCICRHSRLPPNNRHCKINTAGSCADSPSSAIVTWR